MTKVIFIFLFLSSSIFVLLTSHASAHKILVFAYENGGQVITEAKFNSGRPAKNATVEVESNDGSIVVSGLTNEQGEYRFPITDKLRNNSYDLKVIVDVGEGHKGTWLLKASDYLEVDTSLAGDPATVSPPAKKNVTSMVNSAPPENKIEEVIERTLAKELAPIKKMLIQQRQDKIALQDILGGLGYIFGLVGIAAYFKSQKDKGIR